jgi:hypothetical protein
MLSASSQWQAIISDPHLKLTLMRENANSASFNGYVYSGFPAPCTRNDGYREHFGSKQLEYEVIIFFCLYKIFIGLWLISVYIVIAILINGVKVQIVHCPKKWDLRFKFNLKNKIGSSRVIARNWLRFYYD